jgi:hypothetical protein
MVSQVTLPEVEHMFDRLFLSSPGRYAELHPGGGGNIWREATELWNSMTDDEKQPWKELAIHIRGLHGPAFPVFWSQPQAARCNSAGPGPCDHESGQVCIHIKRYTTYGYFID